MRSYPNLELLMGGYFHQDWSMEASTPSGVISHFARSEPNEVLLGLISELDELLAGDKDERDLRRAVDAAGADFDPTSRRGTIAQWLGGVREQVKSALR